jgi:hypothetical protein
MVSAIKADRRLAARARARTGLLVEIDATAIV